MTQATADDGVPDSGVRIEDDDPAERLPTLGDFVDAAMRRAQRRQEGKEIPVRLPWSTIDAHFGGGLWPGVHFITSGTGIGKTQLALEIGFNAARAKVPVAYVGLELEEFQIACRAIGDEAKIPWSKFYLGDVGAKYLDRARAVLAKLKGLPFHPYFGDPHGWPTSRLGEIGAAMRAQYPETDGPGSRPLLLVLDFLQIVGPEDGEHVELRERIARAAYECRALAARLNIAVVVICSVARDKYGLAAIANQAGLTYDLDKDGCPIKRRIASPDALVGLGKESGEIEYSGDSVSVLFRVPETVNEDGCEIILATAKARAGIATWSPLHFSGFRFSEPLDRGGLVVEAWKAAEEKRSKQKEEKAAKKIQAKAEKILADARAIVAFVQANPGCAVARARRAAVGDVSGRWSAAVERIGDALIKTAVKRSFALTIDLSKLPEDVRS